MSNPLVIIQARMGSTRLPGKVLMQLGDKTVIEHVIESVKKTGVKFVVSIPEGDTALSQFLNDRNVPIYFGNGPDVLDRYYRCAKAYKADIIGRVTADCFAILPETIYYMMSIMLTNKLDFLSNTFKPYSTFEGNDFECMSWQCLKWLKENAKEPKYTEHVTNYLYEHLDKFDKTNMIRGEHDWNINLSRMKTSIDTIEDLRQAEKTLYQRRSK